jgi:hypothetical protein
MIVNYATCDSVSPVVGPPCRVVTTTTKTAETGGGGGNGAGPFTSATKGGAGGKGTAPNITTSGTDGSGLGATNAIVGSSNIINYSTMNSGGGKVIGSVS